jgi:hypothetical protein
MDTGKIVLIICLLMASFIFAKAVTGNKSQDKKDNKDETYTVIETNDNFEIREYNTSVVARVDLGSGDYGSVSNQGFRKLANYIFGGNKESQQIAMTSPVMMELGDSASMSFFMPAEYELESLPKPNSGEVLLEEMKPLRVAVIKFGGWANQKKIDKHQEKLVALLEAESIEHTGKFYFLGYNSPFETTNRLNEVIVEL